LGGVTDIEKVACCCK